MNQPNPSASPHSSKVLITVVILALLVAGLTYFRPWTRNGATNSSNTSNANLEGALLDTTQWQPLQKEQWAITFKYPPNLVRANESQTTLLLTRESNLNADRGGYPAIVVERFSSDDAAFNAFVAQQQNIATVTYNGLPARQFDSGVSTYTVFVVGDYQYSLHVGPSSSQDYKQLYDRMLLTVTAT